MINFVAVKILTNDKKIVQDTFGGFSRSYYRTFHNNNILHTLFFLK